MRIISPAFENNSRLPAKYTCDGEGVNPPLSFLDVPANAKSLALIVDDPDAPMGIFTHWILFNLDPKLKEIKENSVPQGASLGRTSESETHFVGACPPQGTHRYIFKLYALDTVLKLTNPYKYDLETAMQDHILEKSEIIGLFSRN